MDNKYQNGKIYKISSCHLKECYIGSTIKSLNNRFSQHKSDYNRLKEGKGHFTSSFEIVCFPDAIISLLHNFPCNSKKELEREEGRVQLNHKNTDDLENIVNKDIAGRTRKEYRVDNKESIKEIQKEYRENNKEKQKEYVENNKEKLKEYKKEYREKNKERIKEHKSQPITCPFCNTVVRRGDIRRHQKSKKCKKIQLQKSKNGRSVSQSLSVPESLTPSNEVILALYDLT